MTIHVFLPGIKVVIPSLMLYKDIRNIWPAGFTNETSTGLLCAVELRHTDAFKLNANEGIDV